MKLQSPKKIRQKCWNIAAAIFLCLCSSVASAQYTVTADFTTRPNGPDTPFSMAVVLNPQNTDVSGFSIRVAFDSSQVTLEGVSDNTGHPAAGADYTLGSPQPLTGVPNVDTYVPVIMDTAFNIPTPGNLAQLNFRTTTAYNDPQNRVWLRLDEHNFDGITDGNLEKLQGVQYQEPTLVPVTLSGFSIE